MLRKLMLVTWCGASSNIKKERRRKPRGWEAVDQTVSEISHDPTKHLVAMDACALGFVSVFDFVLFLLLSFFVGELLFLPLKHQFLSVLNLHGSSWLISNINQENVITTTIINTKQTFHNCYRTCLILWWSNKLK